MWGGFLTPGRHCSKIRFDLFLTTAWNICPDLWDTILLSSSGWGKGQTSFIGKVLVSGAQQRVLGPAPVLGTVTSGFFTGVLSGSLSLLQELPLNGH